MKAFDTHAHLFWSDFDKDRDEVISRAAEHGVTGILNLGTTVDSSQACIALAEKYTYCHAAIGFHPHDVEIFAADPDEKISQLLSLVEQPEVVAVGETGLDFFGGRDTEEAQVASLHAHFDLARRTGLPIVLHNRNASGELKDFLEEYDSEVTAILHCFTGDEWFGMWAIERGHYLGLGGIFTFPSSDLPDMVRSWDLDHLLLETDSPFLSPVPYRGKRNEPSCVIHTARAIAEVVGISPEELGERTTANACRVLGLPRI